MDGNTVSLLQTQMNNERYNAQVYFCLASDCENMAYDGFAKFFRKQAMGELEHAQKFAEFLISKRVLPEYRPLPACQSWTSMTGVGNAARSLEVKTTDDLKTLYDLCDDPQVYALLDWFLTEQVEEETVTADLSDLVDRADIAGLYVLDQKYGNL